MATRHDNATKWISLHNQAQSATRGLQGHQDMTKYHAKWLGTEFNCKAEAEVLNTATAWSGSIPQASGWATNPSILLLHLLAKVEDESSRRSGHMKSQVSTWNVLARQRPQDTNKPAITQQIAHNISMASVYSRQFNQVA